MVRFLFVNETGVIENQVLQENTGRQKGTHKAD